MSPPPPPLGRARRKAGRSAHSFDPALGDGELIEVRHRFAQGRWTGARALLAATGTDWDRRGHRVMVLAGVPSAAGWARDWLLAEPGSPDATTLLACADVLRSLRPKARPAERDRAREACLAAAALAPADPTPWLGLMTLDRTHGTQDTVSAHFEQIRSRHPEHHQAHHLMTARLAEAGSGSDPLHQVYDFAAWAAEHAPADSPLAVLPVVAHAERYRVMAAEGSAPGDPAASGHWTGRRARQVMKAAFDWWLEWEREDHPRHHTDLNFLAHAKVCEGRSAEAAALFHRIGPHATEAPWSYAGRDPYPAFVAARAHALGAP
ncbi:hypothetical protein [Streptomyces nitrosporeus]|uniref:DUF4034 domain-containing protein n=1 Tax=Streptomyces nitrosporeus TaxID=28894 RepID=A0A5J6FGA5_9ACTN|nr:hypothetical protein [Streptomyces nitrosporeus]QEU75302.1 hypothetical protein CP967_27975 [Streptomyces nitrosporeus]GGZ03133.1 hypothetical protein GCM10010327_37190 [Streptomyces nitrosporeus]